MSRTPRDENRVPAIAAENDSTGNVESVEKDNGSGGLKVHVAGQDTDTSISGIADGVKTVSSAGTDEALASSTSCKRVTIQAQTDNTGLIAVGASGVDATEATGTGIILYAGDSYELEIDDLNDIHIDATQNGEGVRFTYFT